MSSCPSVESGQAGKAPSCKGCPNAAACASARPDPALQTIKERLKKLKLVLAIMSGKGGVGKSTVAVSVASALARRGVPVLLVDLDISGPSIPRMTKTENCFIERYDDKSETPIPPIQARQNLFVISAGNFSDVEFRSQALTSQMKNDIMKSVFKRVDLDKVEMIIIDTPPNVTDEHIGLAQVIKPGAAIMVSTPQQVALNDVVRQISFCKKAGIPLLGLLENMTGFECPKCRHINVLGDCSIVESFCNERNINYLGALQHYKELAQSLDSGEEVYGAVFDSVAERVIGMMASINKIQE